MTSQSLKIHFCLIMLFVIFCQDVLPQKNRQWKIDRHARKTPDKYEVNLNLLVNYLIMPANDDYEKVRAFFTWICHNINYDDSRKVEFHPVIYFYYISGVCVTPSCVLETRRTVCEGYCNLFKSMCDIAGIRCEVIEGYVRTYKTSTHAWNAVYINNKWHLLDITNSSGYINYYTGKYVKSQTEKHYFANPVDFLLSHLPAIPMWQLIDCPIGIDVYKKGEFAIRKSVENCNKKFNYTDSIELYASLKPKEKRLWYAHSVNKYNSENKIIVARAYMHIARQEELYLHEKRNELNSLKIAKIRKKIYTYYLNAYKYLVSPEMTEEKILQITCISKLKYYSNLK